MSIDNNKNWSRKYIKRQERMMLLWKQLMATYPMFRQYKTLNVGFKAELIDAVHNNPMFSEDSVYIIEMFLSKYTSCDKYLKNALKFRTRYNLKGEEICPISKKDIAYYDRTLREHNKRKAVNTEKKDTQRSKPNSVINVIHKDHPVLRLNKQKA